MINCGATVKIAFMFCVAFGLGFAWHSAPVVVPTRVATRQIAKYFVDIAEKNCVLIKLSSSRTESYLELRCSDGRHCGGL